MSGTDSQDMLSKDLCKLQSWVLLQGIGCIILINAIFTDINFFATYFPNYNVEFMLPLMLTVPQVVGQLLAIKYVKKMPLKCSVVGLMSFAALLAILLPVLIKLLCTNGKETLAWCLTVIITIYFGLFMAITNSALTGFVSLFPEDKTHLMSIFMLGCSLNSLLVLALQIVTLLCFETTDKGIFGQSMLYFGVTALILIVTAGVFLLTLRHPYVNFVINTAKEAYSGDADDLDDTREADKNEVVSWS